MSLRYLVTPLNAAIERILFFQIDQFIPLNLSESLNISGILVYEEAIVSLVM